MSIPLTSVETRFCRFPGCDRPATSTDGASGRPPEYCDDPAHTRAAAWRARQKVGTVAGQPREEETRPVDAARQRASALRAQVSGMLEVAATQLTSLLEELRTVADPDAAEAQIEAVTTEAAEQVAAAASRASRAEQAQRLAEAERAEADAAATEAAATAGQLQAALGASEAALEFARTEQTDAAEASERRDRAAGDRITELETEIAATAAASAAIAAERDTSLLQVRAAAADLVEAQERIRAAVEHADRADGTVAALRDQLEQLAGDRDQVRRELADTTGMLATVRAERDAAVADVARENTHGSQRVDDVRVTYSEQLAALRTELAAARSLRADASTASPTRAVKSGRPSPTAPTD